MSSELNELDKILTDVAESAWSLGLQNASLEDLHNDRNNRMTPGKAKAALLLWSAHHTQEAVEAELREIYAKRRMIVSPGYSQYIVEANDIKQRLIELAAPHPQQNTTREEDR